MKKTTINFSITVLKPSEGEYLSDKVAVIFREFADVIEKHKYIENDPGMTYKLDAGELRGFALWKK